MAVVSGLWTEAKVCNPRSLPKQKEELRKVVSSLKKVTFGLEFLTYPRNQGQNTNEARLVSSLRVVHPSSNSVYGFRPRPTPLARPRPRRPSLSTFEPPRTRLLLQTPPQLPPSSAISNQRLQIACWSRPSAQTTPLTVRLCLYLHTSPCQGSASH